MCVVTNGYCHLPPTVATKLTTRAIAEPTYLGITTVSPDVKCLLSDVSHKINARKLEGLGTGRTPFKEGVYGEDICIAI